VRVPLTVITAVLLIGGAAVAAPPKTAPVKRPQPTQPANPPAQIVLASAEAVHAPTTDGAQSTQAPKRRVAPRVTSCRCGDPQVDPETQNQ